jgi:hypothetical protein
MSPDLNIALWLAGLCHMTTRDYVRRVLTYVNVARILCWEWLDYVTWLQCRLLIRPGPQGTFKLVPRAACFNVSWFMTRDLNTELWLAGSKNCGSLVGWIYHTLLLYRYLTGWTPFCSSASCRKLNMFYLVQIFIIWGLKLKNLLHHVMTSRDQDFVVSCATSSLTVTSRGPLIQFDNGARGHAACYATSWLMTSRYWLRSIVDCYSLYVYHADA